MKIRDLQEQLDTATSSFIVEESEWLGHVLSDPWTEGSPPGWYPVGDPDGQALPPLGMLTWQWQWHELDGTPLGDPINVASPSENPNSNLWSNLPPNSDGTPREVPKIFDPNSIEAISNQPFDIPSPFMWDSVVVDIELDEFDIPVMNPVTGEPNLIYEWIIINQDGTILGGPYDFSEYDIPYNPEGQPIGTPGDIVIDDDPLPPGSLNKGGGGGDKGGGGNQGGGGDSSGDGDTPSKWSTSPGSSSSGGSGLGGRRNNSNLLKTVGKVILP